MYHFPLQERWARKENMGWTITLNTKHMEDKKNAKLWVHRKLNEEKWRNLCFYWADRFMVLKPQNIFQTDHHGNISVVCIHSTKDWSTIILNNEFEQFWSCIFILMEYSTSRTESNSSKSSHETQMTLPKIHKLTD